jgi:hypothetical protein
VSEFVQAKIGVQLSDELGPALSELKGATESANDTARRLKSSKSE